MSAEEGRKQTLAWKPSLEFAESADSSDGGESVSHEAKMEPEPEGRGGGGDSADTSTSLSTLNSSTLYSLAEVPTRLQPKDSAPGTQRFGAGDKKCAPAIHALGCARPCSCSAPTCAHRPRSAGCAPALILPPVRGVRCAPPLWGPNRDPQTAAKRNGDPASAARLSDRAGGVSLRFCGRPLPAEPCAPCAAAPQALGVRGPRARH